VVNSISDAPAHLARSNTLHELRHNSENRPAGCVQTCRVRDTDGNTRGAPRRLRRGCRKSIACGSKAERVDDSGERFEIRGTGLGADLRARDKSLAMTPEPQSLDVRCTRQRASHRPFWPERGGQWRHWQDAMRQPGLTVSGDDQAKAASGQHSAVDLDRISRDDRGYREANIGDLSASGIEATVRVAEPDHVPPRGHVDGPSGRVPVYPYPVVGGPRGDPACGAGTNSQQRNQADQTEERASSRRLTPLPWSAAPASEVERRTKLILNRGSRHPVSHSRSVTAHLPVLIDKQHSRLAPSGSPSVRMCEALSAGGGSSHLGTWSCQRRGQARAGQRRAGPGAWHSPTSESGRFKPNV